MEKKCRLSRSILWRIQCSFYQRQGIEAWRQGTVPHYISSNTFMASTYARMVLGFLRDCRALLVPGRPVYIIELGSGSGRLGYQFLKKFFAILEQSPLKSTPMKFVMTDLAEQNVGFWRDHPYLEPFISSGRLDFAVFDANNPDALKLTQSGEVLTKGTVCNPVVLIANYFFDSIPQDCFRIEKGQLYEGLLTIVSRRNESDLEDPDLLQRIKFDFDYLPVDENYYDDQDFNRVLGDYRKKLSNTVILFPCAALECLRYFHDLSRGRLFLISGDKGYSLEESLSNRGSPAVNVHGSFSMMVNYHALGEYVRNRGGAVLETSHRHSHINVSGYVWGLADAVETRLAYLEEVEKGGPDDFFSQKRGMEKSYGELSFQQILAHLRLSGWDSNIFLGCFSVLMEQAERIPEPWRREVYRAVEQVWDNYFPIGEKKDLAFNSGMLLYGIGYYREAIEFFHRSVEIYGSDPSTLYNEAMCYYKLGQFEECLGLIDLVLELDAGFEGAKDMRRVIQGQVG